MYQSTRPMMATQATTLSLASDGFLVADPERPTGALNATVLLVLHLEG